MEYFSIHEQFLFVSFDIDVKEREKLDQYLSILKESGVEKFFKSSEVHGIDPGGRPGFKQDDLFATILYGFAFGKGTLRELESSCRYDLRYIYLMEQQRPTYVVFCNFINSVILPNINEIFAMITATLIAKIGIDTEEVFIDGTKLEADANKYKFVWKPTTFHNKLGDKIRELLSKYDLERNLSSNGIIDAKIVAKKYNDLCALKTTSDRQLLDHDIKLMESYLLRSLEYEEKEEICGPGRNSYYKTDYGATAMCLKEDYYSGLGSNMHAAYNIQLAVSKGIIKTVYVSQSRNDISDLIPTLDKYKNDYHVYPKIVCADSGYGSYENYKFITDNCIGNYIKHQSWEGNKSGKRPDRFTVNEDHTITCLNGHIGTIVELKNRHPRHAQSVFFLIKGCKKCVFRKYCKKNLNNKSGNDRIFEVNIEFNLLKQAAEKNLLSKKGIELRVNRSSQVEGAFGVLKQDMFYVRARRITLERVQMEIELQSLGYNIRKLFRFFDGEARFTAWEAPDNLQNEQFKKPSSNKLSKSSKKKKSVNEIAKSIGLKKAVR